MSDREWPVGHPLASDTVPGSDEAIAWRTKEDAKVHKREWPVGHPSASDTQAKQKDGGYVAQLVPDEVSLKNGCIAVLQDGRLACCDPISGDVFHLSQNPYKFDPKSISIENEFTLPSGKHASVVNGVWQVR